MGPTRQASSLHVAAALPGAAGPGSGPCRRTPEHRVGSPPRILLVVDYVGDGAVHIHRGHPLTQPVALHERGGHRPHLQAGGTRRGAASAQACMAGTQPSSWLASHRCRPAARRQHKPPQAPSQPLAAPSRQHSARPFAPHQPEPHALEPLGCTTSAPPAHLEVVWAHEDVCDAGPHNPHDPLVKVAGLALRRGVEHLGLHHARQALDLREGGGGQGGARQGSVRNRP